MSLFANIIRGGQLSLHAIRMFKQVFNMILYPKLGQLFKQNLPTSYYLQIHLVSRNLLSCVSFSYCNNTLCS